MLELWSSWHGLLGDRGRSSEPIKKANTILHHLHLGLCIASSAGRQSLLCILHPSRIRMPYLKAELKHPANSESPALLSAA
jgi:hypothetical protein